VDLLPVYVSVGLVTVFLNTADVYFLQTEQWPPLQKSPSFWLYLLGQVGVTLFAAYLMLGRTPQPALPVVVVTAPLLSYSLLQSITLQLGGKGIDTRELFDTWKRRVLADVARSNTSSKRAEIVRVSRALAARAKNVPNLLVPAIQQLATAAQLNPQQVITGLAGLGQDPDLMMAQWVATADLDFAKELLR
jgi:hypothetical protein